MASIDTTGVFDAKRVQSTSTLWAIALSALLWTACVHEDSVAIRECSDGETDLIVCDDETRVVERHCENERWVPEQIDCAHTTTPRSPCAEARVETLLCDDGQSTYERQCIDGVWKNSACAAIEECAPNDVLTVTCPYDDPQEHTCVDRTWQPPITCATQCLEDEVRPNACGLNLRGTHTRACVGARWADSWVCEDPDQCVDGDIEHAACDGWTGANPTSCIEGQWTASHCQNITLIGSIHDHDMDALGFCALDANNEAWCWGANADAQLGAGHTRDAPTIQRVVGDFSFQSIARGPRHACGITGDNLLYCWGSNEYGQLAHPDDATQISPQKVKHLSDLRVVAAGPRNTCVIDSDEHLYCWGSNAYGQLADETWAHPTIPRRIADLEQVQDVAIGQNTLCAIVSSGQLYCWGDNRHAQASESIDDTEYTPVAVYNMDQVSQVAVASEHACAIRNAKLYCWGDNSTGQLGDGTTTASPLPQPVPLPEDVAHIAVGRGLSCAATTDHALYCWGESLWGELDDEIDPAFYNTPQQISIAHDIAKIAIASGTRSTVGHTLCSATTQGKIACWGRNTDHSIPDESVDRQSHTPIFIAPD